MDIDNIKRGLRAEIKKRENEQYFTFQCNVRQMCKDVLAKLEEQESEIASLNVMLQETCLERDDNIVVDELTEKLCHQKYKRCLCEAKYWLAVIYQCVDDKHRQSAERHHRKWLELAEKFKEVK